MKYSWILFFASICFACHSSAPQGRSCKTMTLDCSDNLWSVDVSHLFEPNLEIIPLETTDNCLVRADDQKWVTEKYIYITDRVSKKIFMFDWKGKYLRTIGQTGRGPGEYVDLNGMCVMRDTLYVHDQVQSKLIAYPVQGGQFHEIFIAPPIYSSELATAGNYLYFITNYTNGYNLIRMDLKDYSTQHFLPYASEIEKNGSWWGLNNFSSSYRDSLIFTFSQNDTIYGLSDNVPKPLYCINFPHNKIPENLLTLNGTQILQTALKDGYITGLDEIYNTKSFIMGGFGKGNQCFYFMYSKADESVLVAQSLDLGAFGKLSLYNYLPTDNDELVFFYDVLFLKEVWKLIISKNDFQNPKIKEQLEQVIQNAKDDDNPIMFKIRFK